MSATQPAWVPGIPLYSEDRHPNSRYLFNWRDSSDGPVCNCADAARWPEPRGCNDLGWGDELAGFLAACVRDGS